MTPQGAITAYPISFGVSGIATGLTVGPDGNLWYIWTSQGEIGRVTPAGKNTLLKTASTVGAPQAIVSGPAHSLWLACAGTTVYTRTLTRTYSAAVEAVTPGGSSHPFPISGTALAGIHPSPK
jgi:streptogramin lyase